MVIRNWVTNLKNMLNDYGFGYLFENPNVVQVNSFVRDSSNVALLIVLHKKGTVKLITVLY